MGKRSRFHTWLRKASDKALENEYERRRRLDDGREMKRISCEMGRRRVERGFDRIVEKR